MTDSAGGIETLLARMPDHWTRSRVRYVCRVETGSRDTVEASDDGEYPFFVRSPQVERIETYSYDTEAVLTAGDGDVGKVFHHYTGKFDAHQRVYVFKDFKSVLGRFFYYWFSNEFHHVTDQGTAESTVASLRRPMIVNFPVPVPPLGEQRTIADFLDRETAQIDAMVDAQERLVALLEERRIAVVLDAVTTGIRAGASELGEPPSHWDRLPIKALGRTQSGVGFPDAEQGLSGLPFPFYKVNALGRADDDGVIRERYDTIDADAVARLRASVIPAGSVVLAKIGAALLLSRFRLLAYDSCIDNNMLAFIPNQQVIGRYAMYAFEQLNLDQLVNPGAVPSLSDRVLRDFRLAWPPIDEQAEIVDHLDRVTARIDAMIAKARESIALMKERRAAVISAAVTGRIDVRTGIEQVERDLGEARV